SGAMQLVLLAFGVVVGATLVEPDAAFRFAGVPHDLIGWWTPWLGIFFIGGRTFIAFSAPGGAFGWFLLVLVPAGLRPPAGGPGWGRGGGAGGSVRNSVGSSAAS